MISARVRNLQGGIEGYTLSSVIATICSLILPSR